MDMCGEDEPDYELFEGLYLWEMSRINDHDSRGELVLNAAIQSKNADRLLKILSNFSDGPHPEARDARGVSALDIAEELGLHEIVNRLREEIELSQAIPKMPTPKYDDPEECGECPFCGNPMVDGMNTYDDETCIDMGIKTKL